MVAIMKTMSETIY